MYRLSILFAFAIMAGMSAPLTAEQLLDPTRPLDYRQSSRSEVPLNLNSILIGKGRRIAVINGQQMAEREQRGDIYVLRILPNRVIVRRNDKQIELELHNPITRKNES